MSAIGPNLVEPDNTNWDTVPVGQGVAAGPVEHNGNTYVAGQRIDKFGVSKLAVFRSSDSFTSDRNVLDFSNGPDCNFASRSGVVYSPSDHRFYFSNVDPAGKLSIAAFDVFSESWVLNDTGGPSGPNLGVDGCSIARTSTGAFLFLYTNRTGSFPSILHSLNLVEWSGVWGTPHTFLSSIPDNFGLVASPITDANDSIWTSYIRFVGTSPFPVRYYSINVTAAGLSGTPILLLDITANLDIGGGPSWYIASLDTVVMPFAIVYTNLGPTQAEFHAFKISGATTSPVFTDVLVTSTGFGGDPSSSFPGAFLSNAAESKFSAFVTGQANLGTDEQLWRFESASLSSWVNPYVVDWDYDTNPPQAPPGSGGIEPDSCLAPAYLDNETAYGTLLTFFFAVCPELYYLRVPLTAKHLFYHPHYWATETPAA